ncbi:MAG TPA: phosphoribosylanthranilate isomerase [Candidatus Binatia bacterium]|nr:phosphoribosylanthranilate isomerase [Candidatus Binatia bacterium]
MVVKVCGIRTPEIAECAIEAGADWLGLVFEPRSPRHVEDAAAEAVRQAVAGRADLVGVMVAPSAERCRELSRRHRLAAVQVHGPVEPRLVTEVDVTVIRAINPPDARAALVVEWWPDCPLLLDSPPARPEALPGGTGLRLDLALAAEVAAHRRVILAGGLTPDSVAEAIGRVRPWGVDASSGLESQPGVKDPGRVRDFVVAAREAFERLAEAGRAMNGGPAAVAEAVG